MLYFPIFTLTTGGTIGYAMSDTWCKNVWHQLILALKPNITREEARALNILKLENSTVVLTKDKGVAMVVLDKQEYINKTQDLLGQRNAYRTLGVDTANKHKINAVT